MSHMITQQAVAAAKEGADDRILTAMLESARQQDESTRLLVRMLAVLLVCSMLANVVLVALTLSGSLSVSGFGAAVSVGSGQPQAEVQDAGR